MYNLLILFLFSQAGIGTDATTADHIKKLLDRYYATKDSRSQFSPTNLVCLITAHHSFFAFSYAHYFQFMRLCTQKVILCGSTSVATH